MKHKQIDNVIIADIPQWQIKSIDDEWAEMEAFFEADSIRRQQNTVHHNNYIKLLQEGRGEEAMAEWNKKK